MKSVFCYFKNCQLMSIALLLAACSSGASVPRTSPANPSDRLRAIMRQNADGLVNTACQTIIDSTGTHYTASHVGGGDHLDIEYGANSIPCQIGLYIAPTDVVAIDHVVINGPFTIGLYVDNVAKINQNHISICANGRVNSDSAQEINEEQDSETPCASGAKRSTGTAEELRGTSNLSSAHLDIQGYSAGFATQPCPNPSNSIKFDHARVADSNFPWSFQGGNSQFNHAVPPVDLNPANACLGSAVEAGISSAVFSVTGTIEPPLIKLSSADGRTVIGVQLGRMAAPTGTTHVLLSLRSPAAGSNIAASTRLQTFNKLTDGAIQAPQVVQPSIRESADHSLSTIPADVCAPFWFSANPVFDVANWICIVTDGPIQYYTDVPQIFTVYPPFDRLSPYYYCNNNWSSSQVYCEVTTPVDVAPSSIGWNGPPESLRTLGGTVTFFLPGFTLGKELTPYTTLIHPSKPALFAIGAATSNFELIVHRGQSAQMNWTNAGACQSGCTWFADGVPPGITASYSPKTTYAPPNAVTETFSAASTAALGPFRVGAYVVDGFGQTSGITRITLIVQP